MSTDVAGNSIISTGETVTWMRTLTSMAEKVDKQFEEVTVHIDGNDRHTLVVNTSSGEKAEKVISFLEELGARTEREWYDEEDVRVLALPN